MFATTYALVALDIAAERTREAERRARLRAGAGPDFAGPGRLRHDLARVAALISRRSAALAERLDDAVLVDTGRCGPAAV